MSVEGPTTPASIFDSGLMEECNRLRDLNRDLGVRLSQSQASCMSKDAEISAQRNDLWKKDQEIAALKANLFKQEQLLRTSGITQ